jgi:hypothetical protein
MEVNYYDVLQKFGFNNYLTFDTIDSDPLSKYSDKSYD